MACLQPKTPYAFNDALFRYLERYNGERPHRSLGNITPCQAIQKQLPHLSRMWWPRTSVSISLSFPL